MNRGAAKFLGMVLAAVASSASAVDRCGCGDPVCAGGAVGAACDRHARSGYGLCVAPWAKLAYGPKYKGYYVGGSATPWPWSWRVAPQARYPWEGTWGRDYAPPWSAVELWWTHGGLYQDGGGQYEPDRRNWPFDLRFGKNVATAR